MMQKTKTFCLAHKPPLYPLPSDTFIIWLGGSAPPATLENEIIPIGSISHELDALHPFLGGSAGTFAVDALLSSKSITWDKDERISLVTYRKFVTKDPVGVQAPNYPGMYLSSPRELVGFDLGMVQNPTPLPYLVPQLIDLNNTIYSQYAGSHKAQDILRFTANAIDIGILSWEQSAEFLSDRVLIPGGIEMGIYPIEVFLKVVRDVRLTCLEFLKCHRPTSLDPYQRRAVSFCNERLGSYLLRRQLVSLYNGQIPAEVYGYMHNVTDEHEYVPGDYVRPPA